jgi:geranylgeranyl diphosphate synthase type II
VEEKCNKRCFMNAASSDKISNWRGMLDSRLASLAAYASPSASSSELHSACAYVVQSGGKRLRGLLTCGVWDDLAGGHASAKKAFLPLASAAAIEVLHAASLVHDDLPALDNDDVRRGRPSCHKAFTESTAILTGDALFGAAIFEVATEPLLSTDVQARACKLLGQAWWDLCLGQQLDIAHKDKSSVAGEKRSKYQETIRLKTGALFGASVALGALCAGVRDSALSQYAAWGTRVGECFQALDDLEDGDRPKEDKAFVESECRAARQAVSALDPRLSSGSTQAVLNLILGT